MKKYTFEDVCPMYTGGGIYVFCGKSNIGYFGASDESFDVYFYDTSMFDEDGELIGDFFDGCEWHDAHVIENVDVDNLKFFEEMLKWAIKNHENNGYHPYGNYQVSDLKDTLERLHEYKKEIMGEEERDNVIIKDETIIGYPKDLTRHFLNQIKYFVGNGEEDVCAIIDCAHVLEDLLNYNHDDMVVVEPYDDGTLGCCGLKDLMFLNNYK